MCKTFEIALRLDIKECGVESRKKVVDDPSSLQRFVTLLMTAP